MSLAGLRKLRYEFEKRLGRALVEQGVISRQQLEEALSLQVVTGGHLTTNLWDLGMAGSAAVASICAQIASVPAARAADLATVPPAALRLVAPALAGKARAIPYNVEGNVLHVATCEPWNVEALEAISRTSGHRLVCTYVTEVDLVRLLHRHYGLPVSARVRLGPQAATQPGIEAPAAPHMLDADLMSEEAFEAVYSRRIGGQLSGEETSALEAVQAGGEELPEIDLLPEDEVVEPPEPIDDLQEAIRLLDAAHTRRGVGNVMTRLSLSRGKRVVLLVRRATFWTGWIGAGEGVDSAATQDLLLSSERGTLFGLVGETGAHYLGPIADHKVHSFFLRALGGARPRSAGLFPVHYRGRIVFGIYLDGGPGELTSPDVADILLLAQRVPVALDRIVQERLA